MIRRVVRTSPLVLTALLFAAPVSAQIVHSVHFGVGGFFPRGLDSRVTGDVLVATLHQPDVAGYPGITSSLALDVDDFRSWTVFGEWNMAFGTRVERGLGSSYYSSTVHSLYRDREHGLRPNLPNFE